MPQNIRILDTALTPELCQALIHRFTQDSRVEQDPQPDYSERLFLFLSDKPDWLELLNKVEIVSNQIVGDYFAYPPPYDVHSRKDWFDDGYVLAHYRKNDVCAMHDDGQVPGGAVRLATLLFYLNDAEGGETHFPLQGMKVAPKQGRAVIFPPTLQYPHEVLPAGSDRFILQTWITDPELLVLHRDELE